MMVSQKQFAADGAWCFFADPRALYFKGEHERAYISWLTSRGDVMLAHYDYRSGTSHSIMVKEALQQDDHANPALYIDELGNITIFYSAHNGPAMYYRATSQPEDITSLGEAVIIPTNTEGRYGYTYPNPIYLSSEQTLYLFWRGGNFKPNFSKRFQDGTGKWTEVQTLLADEGHRPYTRYASNGVDTIHFACTNGHPNIEPTNSIYYACYRDGAYYHADGSLIKDQTASSLKQSDLEIVFNGVEQERNAWIWDIATDKDNHPVIVYAVFAALDDHRYYYSKWDGVAWVTNEITATGKWFPQTVPGEVETEPYYSGGIILDHNDPSVIYYSKQVDGVFEIWRGLTSDNGESWELTAITSASSANQVRPFVVRNNDQESSLLLWMSGNYVRYTNYETELRMALI